MPCRKPFAAATLKRIPIAACNQRGAACALLGGDRRGEKVIRLEPWGFGVRKPACGNKFRQYVQLLDQILVELSPALIGRKHLAALRRRLQAVPADNDSARLLVCVKAQQEIHEAKDSARAFPDSE
jgi:hypothetical protein